MAILAKKAEIGKTYLTNRGTAARLTTTNGHFHLVNQHGFKISILPDTQLIPLGDSTTPVEYDPLGAPIEELREKQGDLSDEQIRWLRHLDRRPEVVKLLEELTSERAEEEEEEDPWEDASPGARYRIALVRGWTHEELARARQFLPGNLQDTVTQEMSAHQDYLDRARAITDEASARKLRELKRVQDRPGVLREIQLTLDKINKPPAPQVGEVGSDQLEELRQRAEKAEEEARILREEKAERETDLVRARTSLALARREIEALLEEKEGIISELAASTDRFAAMRNKLEATESSYAALEAEKETAWVGARQRAEWAEEELRLLREEMAERDLQLEGLSQKVKAAEASYAALCADLRQKTEEENRLLREGKVAAHVQERTPTTVERFLADALALKDKLKECGIHVAISFAI